jgi:glycosyltransferase involved in cell wall biosynthesis
MGRVVLDRLHACVVSSKECWEASAGWYAPGGFPAQVEALGSLFGDLTVVILRGDQGIGGTALPRSARVVPLACPAGRNLRRKISVLARLPYYLTAIARSIRTADVVYVDPPGDIPLLGLLIAMSLRKRVIARYCGSWQESSETTLMNRLTKALMRRFSKARNLMLATGECRGSPAAGMHWLFATSLSRREIESVRPNFDRILNNPPCVVFAGRLVKVKGLTVLVRAITALRREGFSPLPNISLAGDGPERAALERMIRSEGLESWFTFLGQLGRSDLGKLLLRADLCVQPSLSEGFSKAWLDAMAYGLPVLTSTVGAAADVVGGDGTRGWLVPPGDDQALAAKLRHVLGTNQDWAAIRRRCRSYALERTLEAWASRIGELCSNQWSGEGIHLRAIP